MKETWKIKALDGFKPWPQSSLRSAIIVARINGGGYIWHKWFPWLKIKINNPYENND